MAYQFVARSQTLSCRKQKDFFRSAKIYIILTEMFLQFYVIHFKDFSQSKQQLLQYSSSLSYIFLFLSYSKITFSYLLYLSLSHTLSFPDIQKKVYLFVYLFPSTGSTFFSLPLSLPLSPPLIYFSL